MPDMWKIHEEDPTTWAVITTNTTITARGSNVMGGGLALAAANRNSGLPWWYADRIIEHNIAVAFAPDRLLLVPTKRDVREDSTMELVLQAIDWLRIWAGWNPEAKILLPKLGCGLGGLDIKDVGPKLQWLQQCLPEQVVLV